MVATRGVFIDFLRTHARRDHGGLSPWHWSCSRPPGAQPDATPIFLDNTQTAGHVDVAQGEVFIQVPEY